MNQTRKNPLRPDIDWSNEKIMFILAGCNGAGKTTAFKTSLYEILGRPEFINSDEIARGLCPEDVDSVQAEAGRITVKSIHAPLAGDKNFCVETTLATRTFQCHIREAHKNGFKVALFYYWLESPDLAVARVEERVNEGGHHVPEKVVRHRYDMGIRYLSRLYMPKVDYWQVINSGGYGEPEIIASSYIVVNKPDQFNVLLHYGQDNQNR